LITAAPVDSKSMVLRVMVGVSWARAVAAMFASPYRTRHAKSRLVRCGNCALLRA
jgi:hypothetical protein